MAFGTQALLECMESGGGWWEEPVLRAVFPKPVKPLAYGFGPEGGTPQYAFLCVDAGPHCKRSIAALKGSDGPSILAFDIVDDTATLPEPITAGTVLIPGPANYPDAGVSLRVQSPARPALVWSTEVAGARIGGRVVLFRADLAFARSSVFFEAPGTDALKILVTGLAPGDWQIWWNGWLEHMQAPVNAREAALEFTGKPGSYFLRRLG